MGDPKCALIFHPLPPQFKTFRFGTPSHTHTPPSALTFLSQDTEGAGVSPVHNGPSPGVRAQFPVRLQGRRPTGKGRVKSAFQLPGKKGGGGGEREEEKQTRSVCQRHKARYTKGAQEGRRGLPGARFIPTPARGLGVECGPCIPALGPAGEGFPRRGCVRSSAAPHPEERFKVSRRSGARRAWTSEGAVLSVLLRQPPTHPSALSGDTFFASPTPEAAP